MKLREIFALSDFYIFLEEDKGLNQKEIKNLSKEELDKYSKILYAEARLIEGLTVDNQAEISKIICDLISE